MEMLNPNKSPEQNLSDYKRFFKKHPFISVIVIVIMLALSAWNSYLQYTGKKIKDYEQTVNALNRELEAKRAEIQRLETQLVPFKTFALEHYPGSEAEALAKLGQEIKEMKSTIVALRDYSEVAKYDFGGLAIRGDNTIIFSSTLSNMMEGTYTLTDNQFNLILTPEAEAKSRAVIERFPNFPFAYYHVAACLISRNDNNWKIYAQKALEILKITTTIDGHNAYHNVALNKLLTLLNQ